MYLYLEAYITSYDIDHFRIFIKFKMHIFHSERNNSIWIYFHEYFYEIILLVWVQRHQNIALYCRFQNQSQSGKGRELQFQDISAPELTIFFWFSESTLSLIALKAPPHSTPIKESSLRCKSTLAALQLGSKSEKPFSCITLASGDILS